MPPVSGFESESTVEDFASKRKVGFVEILKFGKKKNFSDLGNLIILERS